jgi:hypothetical protein
MVRKVVLGVVVLVLVVGLGVFFWARSVLSQDTVRAALADQLSKAIGQPVTVDGVSATIYPRITVTLTGVSIGEPARIRVNALDVGTDLRALLSRRIEHAALHLNGARIELPLPPMTLASADTGADAGGAPVHLVSVDEVVLNGIEIVSRGRTVRGDIDVVPRGTSALTIRRIALVADQAAIDGTGEITNLAGPVGTIDLKAGALDLDQLMAFATDFVEGSGAGTATASTPTAPSSAPPAAPPMDLAITMTADRATMAGLSMETIAAKARLTNDALTLDPVSFNLFGGTYEGALGATLVGQPTFRWKAALSNVDMGAVTTFAGSPGALTGRLAANVDLSGQGADAATAMKTVRGTATVSIVNGVVKNLALVRSAVAATSLDPQAVIDAGKGPQDEPFTDLGASLSIAGGSASTQDLHFVSRDIRLDAAGAFKLDGSVANLTGQVQMSEELSKQAAATFVRLTQENGRITLPATVRAMNGRFSVSLDTAGMAKRALRNEVEGKAQDAIKRGLGGLLRR